MMTHIVHASVRRFLIWGAGGHGKVVADLIREIGSEVAGFIDSDEAKLGASVEPGGARVLCGSEEFLTSMGEGRLPHGADAVALAIGDNELRWRALNTLPSDMLPPIVHATAVISPSAEVGAGTVVLAKAVLNAAACVERGVVVNTGAIIEHDSVVESAAHISPGAILAGGVRIGARAWIGAGAVVIQGVSIGVGAVVGAGAVVIRDVAHGTRVAGVPAREI